MLYDPPVRNLLCALTYGSHLYGTNTPTSDHDFKAVYLPELRDLILTKTPKVLRFRFDANGDPVGGDKPMPDNGYEAEHVPVQKFVQDWLSGQAYAVEAVFAVLHGAHELHQPASCFTLETRRWNEFARLCRILATRYVHKNVQGMVGFAVKQTFDYVRRGERLNQALKVIEVTKNLTTFGVPNTRLDSPTSYYSNDGVVDGEIKKAITYIALQTGLELGEAIQHDRKILTLKLNGREYLETTSLENFLTAVQKLADQYGERSTNASKTDVDWKSLMHAVRVYQQVLELLNTGTISFPRENSDYLLQIRRGELTLDEVKDNLRKLDDLVNATLATTNLPEVTESFKDEVEDVLHAWLKALY